MEIVAVALVGCGIWILVLNMKLGELNEQLEKKDKVIESKDYEIKMLKQSFLQERHHSDRLHESLAVSRGGVRITPD
jgi:hypothetical protein